MAFAAVGDLAIHYDVQGTAGAPVLLLIHSLGTSLHVWDPLLPALAARFCVLRCDLRGHGLTAGGIDPPSTTIETLADDVLGLMDALAIDQAVVCGVSIGGMAALHLAAAAPERVARLVLCDTSYRIGTPQQWDERVAAVSSGGLAAIADTVIGRWVTPRFIVERPAEAAGLRTMLLRTPSAGYVAGCHALREASLESDAISVRCPTLIIVGDQDASTPPVTAEALAALIPAARLAVLPGAAHLPMVERPKSLAELIVAEAAGQEAVGGYAKGLAVRKAVMGAAHVERALSDATAFDSDFQTYITESVWGTVWTRPGLDRRLRSLLTLALLAALGHHEEFRLHVRATAQTGVTADEVREVLLHVAPYAGVPAANTAFRLARDVFEDMERESRR